MVNMEVIVKERTDNRLYRVVAIKTIEGRVTTKVEKVFYTYLLSKEYAKELESNDFVVALEVLPYRTFSEYGDALLTKVEALEDMRVV